MAGPVMQSTSNFKRTSLYLDIQEDDDSNESTGSSPLSPCVPVGDEYDEQQVVKRSKFDNVADESQALMQMNTALSQITSGNFKFNLGFTTASGKEVKISEEAMKKALSLNKEFESADTSRKSVPRKSLISSPMIVKASPGPSSVNSFMQQGSAHKKFKPPTRTPTASTSRGSPCPPLRVEPPSSETQEVMDCIEALMADENNDMDSDDGVVSSSPPLSPCFPRHDEQQESKLENEEGDGEVLMQLNSVLSKVTNGKFKFTLGFTTASGKEVKISEEAMKKALSLNKEFETADTSRKSLPRKTTISSPMIVKASPRPSSATIVKPSPGPSSATIAKPSLRPSSATIVKASPSATIAKSSPRPSSPMIAKTTPRPSSANSRIIQQGSAHKKFKPPTRIPVASTYRGSPRPPPRAEPPASETQEVMDCIKALMADDDDGF
ncbi:uncharacterized protein LOC110856781 [Folsomia candida]|uniref:Uncharacterized protein n=1 Tax=Folsomia candida TaxID=158441 RepID=A0A226DKA8_FOLCA|nr:uncharacterized protein LOC110856781 [Folsomia candida]OXA45663.1 hypothetical protein Fcan01_19655 [Folsomia candida]